MIYIEENLKEQLEELTPRWKKGDLNQDELKEFHLIIDEIVREARKSRSYFVFTIQLRSEGVGVG